MRTNVVIDDELMKKAQAVLGAKTKRETVEAALRRVVSLHAQHELMNFRGKLQWEGDLDAMRTD